MSAENSTILYVSIGGNEHLLLREDLCGVIKSAGMKVLPEAGTLTDEAEIRKDLSMAGCIILILFPDASTITTTNGQVLLSQFQFDLARTKMAANPGTRLIVWLPPSTDLLAMPAAQATFITTVRNSISENMIFSNAHSALQLVDDLRSLLEVKQEAVYDVKETEIFLVSNQLDENEANEIIDMLTDIVPLQNLSIVQDSDMDYSEYCLQQIGKSKLAVVYFKESGDWALPFAQQVWKKIGGASSHVPILLIGDEDPDTNMDKRLKAPKVISLIVSGQLIPLEIKVQYDKIAELLNK